MIAYRVGYPGWKIAARLGLPLKVKVEVTYDDETGYFTALSDDFNPRFGIAAEGRTPRELLKEVKIEIDEAMEFIFKVKPEEEVKPYLVLVGV